MKLPGVRCIRVGLMGLGLAALSGVCGCADAKPALGIHGQAQRAGGSDIDTIRQDPIKYLRAVQKHCQALEQYTLQFTRQERRGLLQQLSPPERIACWFRRQPFSVHMKWIDPDVKYGEAVYVEKLNPGKVRFVPRRGIFGLPPAVNEVEVMTPVIWGEAKRPITDFGLENMLNRTLETWDQNPGDGTVELVGTTTLLDPPRPVNEVRLSYRTARPQTPVQELFIDQQTGLPVCVLIKRPDGELDSAYLYEKLDTDVHLSDADFVLELDRASKSATAAQ